MIYFLFGVEIVVFPLDCIYDLANVDEVMF